MTNLGSAEKTEQNAPPYASYAIFTTFLDWVKEMPAMPSKIDRSLWESKFAGSTGSQLMAGLRFLKLLGYDNSPLPGLEQLAKADREARKGLMLRVLRDQYGSGLVDGLATMTPHMLDEELRNLGATPGTHRKSVSFFVNAAKANDVTVPAAIGKKARIRSIRPKSQRQTGKAQEKSAADGRGDTVEPSQPPKEEQEFSLHLALTAMLRDLEKKGPKWTKAERDVWFNTFVATLDYAYPAPNQNENGSGEPAN